MFPPNTLKRWTPSGAFFPSLTPGSLCLGPQLQLWVWMIRKAVKSSDLEVLPPCFLCFPIGAIPLKAVTSRFPQVGGNRTSEAPGVVFDPTTKGEGVETSPPNDSFKASLSPPVGRLHSFRRDWQTNKCSSNVLNIITNGYVLPFLSKPNLFRFPLILSEYKARQKDKLWPLVSSLFCQITQLNGWKM